MIISDFLRLSSSVKQDDVGRNECAVALTAVEFVGEVGTVFLTVADPRRRDTVAG